MARGQVSFRVNVPVTMSTVDKRIVGENIIRRIQRRTSGSRDIDGNRFAPYSRPYRDQRRDFGLSGSPDLKFTGEMINNIQVLQVGETFVEIGFNPGSFNARKSLWNQGGNSRIPSRNFLGMQQRQIDSIITQVQDSSPVIDAIRFIEENEFMVGDFVSLGDVRDFVSEEEE